MTSLTAKAGIRRVVLGRDRDATGSLTVTLEPLVVARLRDRARTTGRPVDELAGEAVARAYGVGVE